MDKDNVIYVSVVLDKYEFVYYLYMRWYLFSG